MAEQAGLTELRRGVLGPCVLALLELRPRFGLELVRDLAAADGLLTSDGTVYPLLNRLRDAGLVTSQWRDDEGERARRYYSITDAGRQHLTAFRADWARFSATVGAVLNHAAVPSGAAAKGTRSMSRTALDHRLVREYLRELDAAMRGLPAVQARELREQITAHLDDALPPDAGDQEVAATLSRLGSPADLAAEAAEGAGARAASGSSRPRPALTSRWRLAAVIAVPTVIAAVLGALQISGDVSNYAASSRVQHLAQLNAAVVNLTQDLEDERDLSAAYASREEKGPVAQARTATDAAASTVRADADGVGAGYQPATVQDLNALLTGLTDLADIRKEASVPAAPAAKVIQLYTDDVIGPANTFSAAVGGGTGDTRLQATVTTLAALLSVENEMSVQRAILSAALSAQPPVLRPGDLPALEQAFQQQQADQSDFNAAANTTEQRLFSSTVSGTAVDQAAAQEDMAEAAATSPAAPLTANSGLDAATWYANMSTTIGDTRQVTSQLTGQVTARANALKSNATSRLVLTSVVTLVLLILVLLISAALGRPLTRP